MWKLVVGIRWFVGDTAAGSETLTIPPSEGAGLHASEPGTELLPGLARKQTQCPKSSCAIDNLSSILASHLGPTQLTAP